MDLETFKEIKQHSNEFNNLSHPLRALLIDFLGDWETAHNIVQNDPSKQAAWVHAYLHRKEGDLGNAGYWYVNAGKQFCNNGLDKEWGDIVVSLLK